MITTWLIRGDCHGGFKWLYEMEFAAPEEVGIIILGDAGLNFYLDGRDNSLMKKVNNCGCQLYCVRGNHEARPASLTILYEEVYDDNVKGNVYVCDRYPNIHFFKDWGEYFLGPYSVAVIGGAYSVDKWWRLNRAGVFSESDVNYYNPRRTGWFPNEQLTKEEMKQAEDLFINKYYDFVFTHTCPIDWQPTDLFLSAVNQSQVDSTMELWLNELKDNMAWDVWCFGHYHADRLERPHVEQFFNDIDDLDSIHERWYTYDKTGELEWWLQKSPNFYMT